MLAIGRWFEDEEGGVVGGEEKRVLREGSSAREWGPGEMWEMSCSERRERRLCSDGELVAASVILL